MTKAELDEILKRRWKSPRGADALSQWAPDTTSFLDRINVLEQESEHTKRGRCLDKFKNSKDRGNFFGHVAEVNFAHHFARHGVKLASGVRQEGCTGDVDFCWKVNGTRVFIEMTRLDLPGRMRKSRSEMQQELRLPDDKREGGGVFGDGVSNNLLRSALRLASKTQDEPESQYEPETLHVFRAQQAILGKALPGHKFNAEPLPEWINIIAFYLTDVLDSFDFYDCDLTALGHDAMKGRSPALWRPGVVGVLELGREAPANPIRVAWDSKLRDQYQTIQSKKLKAERSPGCDGSDPYPRDFIHGVLFLAGRTRPIDALSDDLTARIVWNRDLLRSKRPKLDIKDLERTFHELIPLWSVNAALSVPSQPLKHLHPTHHEHR